MNDKESKFRGVSRLAWVLLTVAGWIGGQTPAPAQQVSTLVEFTNVWHYDGARRDLGSDWATNTYVEDDLWVTNNAGLYGYPGLSQYTVHAPINTPFGYSVGWPTWYFRTAFEVDGSTVGLSLFASNLVKDGCVIYLNGVETGRIRVPTNQNFNTYATGTTANGNIDLVKLNPAHLRQGSNLLAVEAHVGPYGDFFPMWGMKLVAVQQTPLQITNQPSGQSIIVGGVAKFEVGVSGGPAFYQWQRNEVNIPGATNRSYTITNVQLAATGEYRVLVTNSVSTVTSNAALLEVLPDITGPRIVSASVLEAAPTNRIVILFNETLESATGGIFPNTRNAANYRVLRCGTTNEVAVTNVVIGTGGGRPPWSMVQLRVDGSNWILGECYHVIVNNLIDAFGNRIPPDSQVSVAWTLRPQLLSSTNRWTFHSAASLDPGVYADNWTATDYVESSWWREGTNVFYGGAEPTSLCVGSLQTPMGFQIEPTLFRATFEWPTNFGNSAQLRPNAICDDGLVLYLNGTEIWRTNAGAGNSALTAASRSTLTAFSPKCITDVSVSVTNLLPGTNWLAVAIVQTPFDTQDSLFGMSLSAIVPFAEPLPETPIPELNAVRNDAGSIRLWWTGGGYALERATNLTDNSASYPIGPWTEVPNMSNPYTNNLSSPTRFFRLKR